MIWVEFVFWICWALVAYSYAVYPALLWLLSRFIRRRYRAYDSAAELPPVSIVMAVRNEENVIEEKLNAIVNGDWPHRMLEVIIGSDASTDATNSIVTKYVQRYPFIRLVEFETRIGKPGVINALVQQAAHPLLLLTDANVIFQSDTVRELVMPFGDPRIGLVGGNIVNRFTERGGIAVHEKNYIGVENRIKLWEGDVFGKMIGPFGGCYMLRKELYRPVPPGFAVDDFYIGMNVLAQRKDAVLSHRAVCLEDVSHDIEQEHRRKRRIANGNFQNLAVLLPKFLNPFSSAAFCFFSHKILRWFGPVLMLVAFVCNLLLIGNKLYNALLFLQFFALAWTLVDLALMRRGIVSGALRYITYFCRMNAALLEGLFDYLKGKQAHVWEPTKRN